MKNPIYNPNETVEVVMRKEVTKKQYYEMIKAARKKGWWILAYEKGYYAEGGYLKDKYIKRTIIK